MGISWQWLQKEMDRIILCYLLRQQQIKVNRQVSVRVEGDKNLLSTFATKLLTVLYKHF